MAHDVTKDDPQLGNKRNELIVQAARLLQKARMVRYDDLANTFGITDLGRIAAKYYLRFSTIETFSKPILLRRLDMADPAILCRQ